MAQNTSSAVMQQRKEPSDSFEYFGTPPWATRALIERGGVTPMGTDTSVWDPACGRGHMTRPLVEYFDRVVASDVQDLGFGEVKDFLLPYRENPDVDWIITNPPFKLATDFILQGRQIARCGVAVLVRTAFAEGQERYEELFSRFPPSKRLQFAERVVMHKGDPPDPDIPIPVINKKTGKPDTNPETGDIIMKKPSTATAYEWMVWQWQPVTIGCRAGWIPPCRAQLTRPGDYIVPEVPA